MVVGLGNPGSEYADTRHNAGFLALDALAAKLHRPSGWKRIQGSLRMTGRAGRHDVTLVKPQEYMNRSGATIRALLSEGWALPELLVVYDEVYLPLGTIRIRPRGGSGGHQGLESILAVTGSQEFPRLRIGVGPAPRAEDLPDYVLAPFAEAERDLVPRVIEAACDCAFEAVAEGLTKAMNRWNRFGRDDLDE